MIALTLIAQLSMVEIDVFKTGTLAQSWVVPAELDGDRATREWVAWDTSGPFTNYYRAIDVRPDGTLCVGSYVFPWVLDGGVWYGYIGRAGDRDKLLLQSPGRYRELTLTPCREQATTIRKEPS